jgi:Xaa-Pro aminopeptidase
VIENKGDAIVITPLDEVAWLTNLRGNDIEFNPLFFSYAIVHKEDGVDTINLYTNPKKVENIYDYLAAKHIKVYPYEQIFSDVSKMGCFKDTKFVIDEAEINTRLYNAMVSDHLINVADLVGELKMVKN